jgi:putative ABC transport system ATP-binding protein
MYISLKNIFKQYDEFKNNQALNDVTFKIEPQEKMVAVVGPSGAGKSTLLNLIAALDQPDSGEIIVSSQNITRLSRSQLANYRLHEIGIIFQFFNLFPTLTVFENIAVPGYLAKTPNKILHRKVEEIAEQVGISHLLKNHPHEVSGGEAQRTAICRALINGPRLLLADEPTGNLDTETAKVIFSLLQSLVEQQKLTVLVVTHDVNLINNVDKVITVKNGRVLL